MNRNQLRGTRAEWPARAATCLRELNLRDVEFLHDLVSEHVSGSEKPTPSAALLVGPRTGLEIEDVVEHMLVSYLGSAI